MSVRFIFGRAGSGKSHHCLEAIRDRIRREPIDGRRLILLVPEQAALQMERAILEPEDILAAHRTEVLSFRRLAHKVLQAAGGPGRRALSEPARAMVLRHLASEHAGRLRYYRRVHRLGGFIQHLSATIAELMEEAVEPAAIASLSQDVSLSDSAVGQAKLCDLAMLYGAYLDYLGTDCVDPSQHLQLARAQLSACPWLCDAAMWVDGFASLSGQESLTLVDLGKLCHHIDITVLADPRVLDASERDPLGPSLQRLFHRPVQTQADLHRMFVGAGIEVEEPGRLMPDPVPRFAGQACLAQLEASLFAGDVDSAKAGRGAPPVGLDVVELPTRRLEVDYAVSRIHEWVRACGAGLRYRDIAVMARDLDLYHDLLREALRARDIPFFIDRRREVAHHPLVELLRAGVAMVAEDLSLDSVRSALKTGLLPLDPEGGDALENYLLAHGLSGRETWAKPWLLLSRSSVSRTKEELTPKEREALARINAARRAWLGWVDRWLAFGLHGERHDGPQWSQAIRDWLDHLGVEMTLTQWATEAQAEGDTDLAAEHEQVWRDTQAFLEDLSLAFSATALSAEDLAAVLEEGLGALTVGLAPPMVDQVLVGSVERSRHPDIKAAILLGFNDGVFPAPPREDTILNDDDRIRLDEHGVRVSPPARERMLDEPLLLYIALTRASEAVVITYAAADSEGRTLRPSAHVASVRAVFPALAVQQPGDPVRERQCWDILSRRDLARRLAMEFRVRPPGDRDNPAVRSRWNELYEWSRQEWKGDPAFRRAMALPYAHDRATLSPASVEKLFQGPFRTSVSQLESYATCPFQHFARYGLRLREREEASLAPVDVGEIHHAVLEDFINASVAGHQNFQELTEREMSAQLQESCARLTDRLPGIGALSQARDRYLMRRTAAQLARVMSAQRRLAQCGSVHPRAAEQRFGFDHPGSLAALELSTPQGRHVQLRGLIDRVDLAELGDELLGVVIDYKRTPHKRLDLNAVYHGLSLQLLSYLLVLAERGQTLVGRPVRPVASLYVSLAPRYHAVDHPDLLHDRDADLKGTYRPRGLLLAEDFASLDADLQTGWARPYSFYRKSDGEIGHIDQSDAADRTSFQALLQHTREQLGRLADAVLDGKIDVNPYRLGTFSPCSWCAMASVCRFEMGLSDVRFLETLKRSEVFKKLSGQGAAPSSPAEGASREEHP